MYESRRFAVRLAAIFLGSSGILIAAGWLYLDHQQAAARVAAYEGLGAIADLKLRQICNWREERLSDARFFAKARFVAQDVRRFLADPESTAARSAVLNWLNLLKNGDRYYAVIVYDPRFEARLATSGSVSEPEVSLRHGLEKSLEIQDVVMSDLHQDQSNGPISIDIEFPIFEEADPQRGPPIAVILLKLDARQFLFPFIQSWPTHSQTAEALLVRREGDDVLYLNDLRYRKGAALALRVPAGRAKLAPDKVLRGQTGVLEGVDYRGVPVVVAGRLVPGTPWAIIAKVDREELYAPLRRQFFGIVFAVGSLLLACALLVGLLWHQRNAQFLERELAREKEYLVGQDAAERRIRLQAAALESAANAIVITDSRGVVRWANGAFERLTGYPSAEVVGRTLQVLKSGRQSVEFFQGMWKTILDGKVWHGELVNRRKDGSLYHEEMTVTPVRDVQGEITHFIAIKQDVSERKQAEEALRQSEARHRAELEDLVEHRTAQLVEANASLQAFAYTAAHDLRSPLRGITSFSTIALEDYGPNLDATGRSMLERIVQSANQMSRLLNDLLEYSRVSAADLKSEPVSLAKAVSEAVALLDVDIRGKHAVVTVTSPLPDVIGHPATLVLLINNLVSNALKFVPPGGQPRIRIWAEPVRSAEYAMHHELTAVADAGHNIPQAPDPALHAAHATIPMVRLWVEDNGIGIARENLQKIFVAFQRLHGKQTYPGTGLGLAIVRKAAVRMGGQVGVESELGKGSRFWVDLRAVKS
jgi:PAS domain S-box-containing protein